MVAISAEKTNAIQAIFSRSKAVIGVIHCDPFPGSPKYRGKSVSDIVERALRDAENYISGGVHGLIIENHGDIPFFSKTGASPVQRRVTLGNSKFPEVLYRPSGHLSICQKKSRRNPYIVHSIRQNQYGDLQGIARMVPQIL